MLDLAGPNSKGKSTESTMGRCMTVTANHCGSWQRKALLWSNNVNDTLALVAEAEVGKAELLDIVL